MPVVIRDEEILVEHEDAKFYFSPVTLADFFQMPGINQEGIPDKAEATKEFLNILPTKIVKWEGVVDSKGDPVECTPENFIKLPAMAAMSIINKYANASGLSGEFEKNLEGRSNESAS